MVGVTSFLKGIISKQSYIFYLFLLLYARIKIMENKINLDGLELTKVDSSSDDDKEEEYIAHLPPLPPMMTKVGNTNRSLSVKSQSVATMSNRKRLKTSNSIGSTKDLKKLLVGKKKILNTNLINNKHDKSWKREQSNKYQNKAIKEQKKLNAIIGNTPNLGSGGFSRDVEFLRDIIQVRDQRDAYKDIKLLGRDQDVEFTIPIRPLLKVLYQGQRIKMVKGCLLLIFIFVTFAINLYLLHPVGIAYEQDAVLLDLFVDEEFENANFKKTFADIHTIEEWWEWAKGPVIKGLYPTSNVDNAQLLKPEETDYINGYLKRCGPVRFRQFRVPANSCENRRRVTQYGNRLDNKGGTCHAQFNIPSILYPKNYTAVAPFGPIGTFGKSYYGKPLPNSTDAILPKYKYDWNENMNHILGKYRFSRTFFDQNYGKGGYPVYFPIQSNLYPYNKSTNVTATSLINELQRDEWIDKATRAVVVEFNIYNTETGLLSTMQLLTEFFESGYIQTYDRVLSGQILVQDFGTSFDRLKFRLALDVLDMVLVVYYSFTIFMRFYRSHKKSGFCLSITNLFEIVVCICFVMHWYFVYRFTSLAKVNELLDVTKSHVFLEIYDHLRLFELGMYSGSLCFIALCIILLRKIEFNKKIAILQRTIQKSAGNLKLFTLIVLILLFGFSIAAHIVYGSHIEEFMTLSSSLNQMMSFLAGGYDYAKLEHVSPWFTSIFYFMWLITSYFIIMNLIIAILTDGYRLAKEETVQDKWQYDLIWLPYDFRKRFLVYRYRLKFWYLNSRLFNVYIYAICCTSCCKKITTQHENPHGRRRMRTLHTVTDSRHKKTGSRRRSIFSATKFEIKQDLVLSKRDLMVKDWDSELQFSDLMNKAAHVAKNTKNAIGVTSLYKYFKEAYESGPKDLSSCMDVEELCLCFRKPTTESCLHDESTCLAMKIILAYRNHRSSFLIGAHTRETGLIGANYDFDDDRFVENKFKVEKINKYGMLQKRTMIVDPANGVIRSFDTYFKLRKILDLTKLQQIDISNSDPYRLEMLFQEGYYSYCQLIFRDTKRRRTFIHQVLSHAFNSHDLSNRFSYSSSHSTSSNFNETLSVGTRSSSVSSKAGIVSSNKPPVTSTSQYESQLLKKNARLLNILAANNQKHEEWREKMEMKHAKLFAVIEAIGGKLELDVKKIANQTSEELKRSKLVQMKRIKQYRSKSVHSNMPNSDGLNVDTNHASAIASKSSSVVKSRRNGRKTTLSSQLKQDADTSGLRRSSLSSVESALDSGFELGNRKSSRLSSTSHDERSYMLNPMLNKAIRNDQLGKRKDSVQDKNNMSNFFTKNNKNIIRKKK